MEEREGGQATPYRGPNWVCDMLGLAPYWKSTAEELRRATRFVWQGVQRDFDRLKRYYELKDYEGAAQSPHPPLNVLVFLAALAIENLLKGIIVIDHPEYVRQGKLRGNVITSHNLTLLAEEANVTLNKEERDFCQLGNSAITGWGRYPIARNIGELMGRVDIRAAVYQVFEDLFTRLCEVMDERFPHGDPTEASGREGN